MSTHKSIDKICCVILMFTLFLTLLFMKGENLGVEKVLQPWDMKRNSLILLRSTPLTLLWRTGKILLQTAKMKNTMSAAF